MTLSKGHDSPSNGPHRNRVNTTDSRRSPTCGRSVSSCTKSSLTERRLMQQWATQRYVINVWYTASYNKIQGWISSGRWSNTCVTICINHLNASQFLKNRYLTSVCKNLLLWKGRLNLLHNKWKKIFPMLSEQVYWYLAFKGLNKGLLIKRFCHKICAIFQWRSVVKLWNIDVMWITLARCVW